MKKIFQRIITARVHPLTVGAVGILGTQTTAAAMNTDTIEAATTAATQAQDPATIIIQIVIALATLYKMFRKNKESQK
jgi:hypothetical protein